MDTLLYSLLVTALLLAFWVWACYENTRNVRKHIRRVLADDNELLPLYEQVTFGQHFKAELRLGNPIALYGARIEHRIAVIEWLGQ